jgi:hypothetical protein
LRVAGTSCRHRCKYAEGGDAGEVDEQLGVVVSEVE